MNNKIIEIKEEIKKVIKGKDEVIDKLLLGFFSDGNILIDDVPGVGKTTLTKTFSKVMDLKFSRIQCTIDLLPSDIIGFTYFDKIDNKFKYKEGVINNSNIVLVDEINRTSSKTQAALLEAMEEKQVTVDGNTYKLKDPFILIATQNEVGSIGTQKLPYAELDRFFISFSIGYPTIESEIDILKSKNDQDLLKNINKICSNEDILSIKNEIDKIEVKDNIYKYIVNLVDSTRNNPDFEIGLSTRSSIDLLKASKVNAYFNNRNYCLPQDVRDVFIDITKHRIIKSSSINNKIKNEELLNNLLKRVKVPDDKI